MYYLRNKILSYFLMCSFALTPVTMISAFEVIHNSSSDEEIAQRRGRGGDYNRRGGRSYRRWSGRRGYRHWGRGRPYFRGGYYRYRYPRYYRYPYGYPYYYYNPYYPYYGGGVYIRIR